MWRYGLALETSSRRLRAQQLVTRGRQNLLGLKGWERMELGHGEPGGGKGSPKAPASTEMEAHHRSKHLHVMYRANKLLDKACLILLL